MLNTFAITHNNNKFTRTYARTQAGNRAHQARAHINKLRDNYYDYTRTHTHAHYCEFVELPLSSIPNPFYGIIVLQMGHPNFRIINRHRIVSAVLLFVLVQHPDVSTDSIRQQWVYRHVQLYLVCFDWWYFCFAFVLTPCPSSFVHLGLCAWKRKSKEKNETNQSTKAFWNYSNFVKVQSWIEIKQFWEHFMRWLLCMCVCMFRMEIMTTTKYQMEPLIFLLFCPSPSLSSLSLAL